MFILRFFPARNALHSSKAVSPGGHMLSLEKITTKKDNFSHFFYFHLSPTLKKTKVIFTLFLSGQAAPCRHRSLF